MCGVVRGVTLTLQKWTNLSYVIKGEYLRGQASVDTEELLVHDGCKGQAVKARHARFINGLRVLDLACGTTHHNQGTLALHHRYSDITSWGILALHHRYPDITSQGYH